MSGLTGTRPPVTKMIGPVSGAISTELYCVPAEVVFKSWGMSYDAALGDPDPVLDGPSAEGGADGGLGAAS